MEIHQRNTSLYLNFKRKFNRVYNKLTADTFLTLFCLDENVSRQSLDKDLQIIGD